ncbi:hypothetical protein WG909_04035 [Peptostreptococcaceae bacterium AGR-M142]
MKKILVLIIAIVLFGLIYFNFTKNNNEKELIKLKIQNENEIFVEDIYNKIYDELDDSSKNLSYDNKLDLIRELYLKKTAYLEEDDSEIDKQKARTAYDKFTIDDINKAKESAIEYYKKTVFEVENLEFMKEHEMYTSYAGEVEKQNIIIFEVEIKNSDNPNRSITIVKDEENNWVVENEGY